MYDNRLIILEKILSIKIQCGAGSLYDTPEKLCERLDKIMKLTKELEEMI